MSAYDPSGLMADQVTLKVLGWLAAALSLKLVADKFDKEAVCSR